MINPKTQKAIDLWRAKFPESQAASAIIPALTLLQKDNGGYLTTALMESLAEYLKVPKSSVFEVATFYSLFDLKPVGKFKIYLCTNVSCLLCGCENIAKHLKAKLNINFNETTPDKKFTLKSVECLAACGGAPMMQINEQYYENLTPEKVDTILAQLDSQD